MKKLFLILLVALSVFGLSSIILKADVIAEDDDQFSVKWTLNNAEISYHGFFVPNWTAFFDHNFPIEKNAETGWNSAAYTFFIYTNQLYDRYQAQYLSDHDFDLDDYDIQSVELVVPLSIYRYGSYYQLSADAFECNLPFTVRQSYRLDPRGKLVPCQELVFTIDPFEVGLEILTIAFYYENGSLNDYAAIMVPEFYMSFAESGFTSLIDVGIVYDDLPVLQDRQYVLMDSLDVKDALNDVYTMTFSDFPYTYSFDIALPSVVTDHEFDEKNFAFGSDEDSRYLFFSSVVSDKPFYLNFFTDNFWTEDLVIFDLLEMTWVDLYKINTLGIVQDEGNGIAALYMFLPDATDYVLNARISYEYRTKSFLFGYSSWEHVEKNYIAFDDDDFLNQNMTEIDPPEWILWVNFLQYFAMDLLNWYDEATISEVALNLLPQNVITTYISDFDGSMYDLEDFTYFRIVLDQFRDVFYQGFDIRDIQVMELTYLRSGVLLTVTQENINLLVNEWQTDAVSFPDLFPLVGGALARTGSILSLGLGAAVFVLVIVGVSKFYHWMKRPKYGRV